MVEKTEAPHDAAAATLDQEVTRGWVSTGEARNAAEQEHRLTIREAIARYPQACFWSCVVSLVVIMDGYDTALIGSLFAFPNFQKRFGVEVGDTGSYQVQAKWQTALGLASPLGNIVGIFVNGVLTERYGHKKTLFVSLAWLTGCIFIAFFAPNVQTLFVGELLCGLSWGVFTTMGPAYASEVTPVVLRAFLETFVVLSWGIGQLIATGVLDGLTGNTTEWGWRIPFAVQWVWPIIIVPFILFAPESPWWLVRKGRIQEAEAAMAKLSSKSIDPSHIHDAVALMIETTELERSMTEGASYWDCFRGDNLWRTEIGCVAWLSQVLFGFGVTSYSTYFFEQAGLSTSNAYKLSVGLGGLHFVCVLVSVFITAHFGRRQIFLWGGTFLMVCMFIIGFVALAPQTSGTGNGSAIVYTFWYACYELTIGPIAYIIVSEVSSTRLRSKSIGLGRNAYNVVNIAATCVVPYVMNPTEGNWKGKAGFLAGGLGAICVAWAYFRLPETMGRTYEELDILFSKKLKAKEFGSYDFNRQTEIEDKVAAVEHHD
ncbi:general substrate transporter [Xylariales sp. PMI_506]|nr:general substrate transporter [Xylariales sp. PMI_506]